MESVQKRMMDVMCALKACWAWAENVVTLRKPGPSTWLVAQLLRKALPTLR